MLSLGSAIPLACRSADGSAGRGLYSRVTGSNGRRRACWVFLYSLNSFLCEAILSSELGAGEEEKRSSFLMGTS